MNSSDDQLAALRRHKVYANLTLLAAAAAWAAAQFLDLPAGLAGYLRAAGEAGLIGGLADWFAVTALFRRPLGLPIPHTALIPRNQARIAEGVARYIDNEFLRREMLIEQLRKLDMAAHLARLFDDPRDRARLVDGIARLLPRLIEGGDDAPIRQALIAAAGEGLGRADLRPVAARLVRGLVEGGELAALIEEACEQMKATLVARRDWLIERVGERTRWYVPRFVDRRLTDSFVSGAIEHLDRLKDPGSEEGGELRRWLGALPERIERSQGAASRLFELVRAALGGPELGHVAGLLWTEMRRIFLADLAAPQSRTCATLDVIAAQFAVELARPPVRREINAAVEAVLAENVALWRERIRGFVAETLIRQTPRDFARRLELQVGPDLQFIRINGTAVGCLVGVALHFLNGFF